MHVSPDLERIFYRLKEMGLEQKAFAQALGTTDKTVSAWKTGRSKSYTKYLPQIAKVIDMPVEYILTGGKKEPAPTPKNGDELDRDAIMAAFIGGDMDMSPEERDALWDDVYEYARFKAEQWRKKKDQE